MTLNIIYSMNIALDVSEKRRLTVGSGVGVEPSVDWLLDMIVGG